MHRIKAAIFDVDGTLFDYREMRIPDSTVSAVRKLKEQGIALIVATARSYAELSEDLLVKIGANYYVAASGHCVQDRDGRELFSRRFTYEQTERIKQIACKYDAGLTLKYPDCNCLYSHPEEMHAIYSNIGFPRCPSVFCETMDYHGKTLPVGFAVRGENGIREQIRQELAAHPGEYRMELFGNGIVADIYAPDANKMTALVHLTERLGIAPENCIAFGDGHNDLEMIRWAGIGVAMGNGREELKAAADLVCGATWEDGIARCLSELALTE